MNPTLLVLVVLIMFSCPLPAKEKRLESDVEVTKLGVAIEITIAIWFVHKNPKTVESVGFTLISNQIRTIDLSSLTAQLHTALGMEVEVPILSVVEEIPSLLQAVAADTLLAAAQSIALIGYLLTNVTSSVLPNLTSMDGRFPFEELFGRKHAYLENKNASETEDDEDGDDDDEDGHDEDDDGEDEEYSGDEGDEEGDPDDDPEANGAGGSDDGDEDDDDDGDDEDDDDGEDDDDEEEEDEEEETPQPPSKKRK
ncbi:hypothetical protein VNO77_24220 [Canavalia gladiata]|uniref:Uncharacterized protein n=1 Tax=Canavalia gladiata TaxID=3824 RepID=A0AAN9Q9P4_CANGL